MTRDIFNDYDIHGYRVNAAGSRSHKSTDRTIVANLREHFGTRLESINDQRLLNEYDEFSLSEMFGDNDARFIEWIEEAGL